MHVLASFYESSRQSALQRYQLCAITSRTAGRLLRLLLKLISLIERCSIGHAHPVIPLTKSTRQILIGRQSNRLPISVLKPVFGYRACLVFECSDTGYRSSRWHFAASNGFDLAIQSHLEHYAPPLGFFA
jgi:hypothetical protein